MSSLYFLAKVSRFALKICICSETCVSCSSSSSCPLAASSAFRSTSRFMPRSPIREAMASSEQQQQQRQNQAHQCNQTADCWASGAPRRPSASTWTARSAKTKESTTWLRLAAFTLKLPSCKACTPHIPFIFYHPLPVLLDWHRWELTLCRTTKAMSGSVPFEAALTARLALMRPSAAQVQACAQMPPRLTSGIASLVTALHARGVRVFLISGGFFELIRPVADLLHIPAENIFANRLLHDEHGEFLGHDTTQPTSRSGGKVLAVREIRQRHQLERICMIGDGTTDLETMGDVELFIGFGGNVVREKVQAAAPWFTHSFAELEALLG
eukprot:m.836753 g.836753  ORF g.836753 m.836753 type:complete len:327 (+) comp59487_c0_seq17:2941-3921(+)